MASKNVTKKNLDEFHQFIDESNKFQELKNIKQTQKKQLIRNQLE